MPAETVVYLSLGSNLGERERNLREALSLLSQELKISKVSSIYETEPVGYVEQPRFLNLVCQGSTRLSARDLLRLAKSIESRLGRTGKTGEPRPIDIDILLYNEQVIDTPELTVPHPRMGERAFVLVPMAEIAPGVAHPVAGKTITELLLGLGQRGREGVVRWKKEKNCTR